MLDTFEHTVNLLEVDGIWLLRSQSIKDEVQDLDQLAVPSSDQPALRILDADTVLARDLPSDHLVPIQTRNKLGCVDGQLEPVAAFSDCYSHSIPFVSVSSHCSVRKPRTVC